MGEHNHTYDSHAHDDDSAHAHSHGHDPAPHGHTHGFVDPSILTSERGIWALKWSFVGLLVTAVLQVVVVYLSGSVALLADTIHNFGDAATAIPLWIAFSVAKWSPTKRFTYGYGRVEDLAGIAIVLTILASAVLAVYQSIDRLFHPQQVMYLWAVVAASVIGFAGNEAVAIFRISVGKEIGSAALVADGYHARVDGFTSLAVLFGALGVWLDYPLADPLVGLLISAAIFKILWGAAKSVFTRVLDGVEPNVVDDIRKVVKATPQVLDVAEVRVRWLGHRLVAEINLAVRAELSVAEAHRITVAAEQELLHKLRYLSHATIHIDPVSESGEEHHRHVEPVHHLGL